MAAAVDRIGESIVTAIAAAGQKPPKVRPLPRPTVAIDRVQARRAWSKHRGLVDEVEEARARRAGRQG